MPATTCALHIYPDGKMKLIFLAPEETEFLGILLNYDCEYQRLFPTEVKFDAWQKVYGEVIIDETLKAFKRVHKKSIIELARNKGHKFDEQELFELWLEKGYDSVYVKIHELTGKYLSINTHDINHALREKGIPILCDGKIGRKIVAEIFAAKRDFNLLLVDPQSGIIKQGSQPVDEAKLLQDLRYIKLTTQAKFYNGVLNAYSKSERKYLVSWFRKEGVEKMMGLLGNIIRARPNVFANYEGSVLERALEQAQQPKTMIAETTSQHFFPPEALEGRCATQSKSQLDTTITNTK